MDLLVETSDIKKLLIETPCEYICLKSNEINNDKSCNWRGRNSSDELWSDAKREKQFCEERFKECRFLCIVKRK